MLYEDSFDYMFTKKKDAENFLKEQIEIGSVEQEEADSWILVKVETTIVK